MNQILSVARFSYNLPSAAADMLFLMLCVILVSIDIGTLNAFLGVDFKYFMKSASGMFISNISIVLMSGLITILKKLIPIRLVSSQGKLLQ